MRIGTTNEPRDEAVANATPGQSSEPRIAKGRFFAMLVATVFGIAVVSAWPIYHWAGPEGLRGWIVGSAASLGNCVWGTWLLLWGIARGTQTFHLAMLVGLIGRMVIALAVVAVMHFRGDANMLVLVLSLVAFYFVATIVELRFLLREVLVSAGGAGAVAPSGETVSTRAVAGGVR